MLANIPINVMPGKSLLIERSRIET
jgi:hypothetical protein